MKKIASNIVYVFLTDASSPTTETKPSPEASSSKFQTSPLPRMLSLTSAAATSSMNAATSIMSTMSGIRLASSIADVAVIANLVPNRGKFSI